MQKSQIKNPAVLYIVRHGQTDWNSAQKIQGKIDIPLNEVGEEQARVMGALLKDVHFDAVFSSDLSRAHKTAQIITLEKQVAIKTTKLLRERDFGSIEGKQALDLKELEKDLEKLSEKERFVHRTYDDMENDEELVGRFLTFLREVAVAYAGKKILVVTHGGLMRTLLVHVGYVDYQKVRKLRIDNTGYFVLHSDGIELEIAKTENIHFEE